MKIETIFIHVILAIQNYASTKKFSNELKFSPKGKKLYSYIQMHYPRVKQKKLNFRAPKCVKFDHFQSFNFKTYYPGVVEDNLNF